MHCAIQLVKFAFRFYALCLQNLLFRGSPTMIDDEDPTDLFTLSVRDVIIITRLKKC